MLTQPPFDPKEKQTIFSTMKYLLDVVYRASTIACTCYKLHLSPLQRFIPLKPIISECNRADGAKCEMMLCLKIITCNICHYTVEGLLFLAWLALYTFLNRQTIAWREVSHCKEAHNRTSKITAFAWRSSLLIPLSINLLCVGIYINSYCV